MSDKGKRSDVRHPKIVSYLESLSAEEAAGHPPVVLEHDGGRTRYWLEDGEVRSCEVGGDGLPALEKLLSAARDRFGDLLPRLAAEAGRPGPDLDSIELALRDGSHASGAAALKAILEDLDRGLPGPLCGSCGRKMARHRTDGKTFMTRLGPVTVERVYRRLPRLRRRPLSSGPASWALRARAARRGLRPSWPTLWETAVSRRRAAGLRTSPA